MTNWIINELCQIFASKGNFLMKYSINNPDPRRMIPDLVRDQGSHKTRKADFHDIHGAYCSFQRMNPYFFFLLFLKTNPLTLPLESSFSQNIQFRHKIISQQIQMTIKSDAHIYHLEVIVECVDQVTGSKALQQGS